MYAFSDCAGVAVLNKRDASDADKPTSLRAGHGSYSYFELLQVHLTE